MFSTTDELLRYIELNEHAESRSCEFKSDTPWNETFGLKITKAVLALSNIPSGGYIVIGVKWNDSTRVYEIDSMDQATSNTYDHERILEFVNIRADPFVNIDLKHFEISGRWLVVIQVAEFLETPVICKKTEGGILEEGRIYHRTHKKPESSANLTYADLREIIDNATTKELGKLLRRLEQAGLNLGNVQTVDSDEVQFAEEGKDFE